MSMESSFRRKANEEQLVEFLQFIKSQKISTEDLQFLCIGTDRSAGDSLGPLVGTFLMEAGYNTVIGTLEYPCDASNLEARIQEIEKGKIVLAIDACLGQPSSTGFFQVANLPIEPARSVGKNFKGVGDYSIAAIVNTDGKNKYSILQNTSLYRVMQMAKQIAASISRVFPL